ncbi:MAG: chromate transporter, partial [Halanaerobiaceae bacterium]
MNKSFKKLLKIFVTFFKIGLFTFGGGFAMIPLMEKELVGRQEW